MAAIDAELIRSTTDLVAGHAHPRDVDGGN